MWQMRRIGTERAIRRICEVALAAMSPMVGILGLMALYRRIVIGEIAFYVTTKTSTRTVNGVSQIIQFEQQVIPIPGFHLPSLWPFAVMVLLLILIPIGAFCHALCFQRFGLGILTGGVSLLAVGLVAALVAGRLLPMYVLIYGAQMLSPALATAFVALAIGAYVERFDRDQFPVA